jgi:hypothetical protein
VGGHVPAERRRRLVPLVLLQALPIRDADERVVRWFGTSTDVTIQRQTEELLLDSRENLRRLKDEAELAKEGAEAANLAKSSSWRT